MRCWQKLNSNSPTKTETPEKDTPEKDTPEEETVEHLKEQLKNLYVEFDELTKKKKQNSKNIMASREMRQKLKMRKKKEANDQNRIEKQNNKKTAWEKDQKELDSRKETLKKDRRKLDKVEQKLRAKEKTLRIENRQIREKIESLTENSGAFDIIKPPEEKGTTAESNEFTTVDQYQKELTELDGAVSELEKKIKKIDDALHVADNETKNIDFSNIDIEKKDSKEITFETDEKYGFSFEGNRITDIPSDSQAQAKGVKVGWRILSIGGEVQTDDNENVRENLEKAWKETGKEVVIAFDTATS